MTAGINEGQAGRGQARTPHKLQASWQPGAGWANMELRLLGAGWLWGPSWLRAGVVHALLSQFHLSTSWW